MIISNKLHELEELTPAEMRGWLDQKVGKYYILWLQNRITELQDDWANGDFTGQSKDETEQKNLEAIGKVGELANILLTLEEMSTDEESDENPDES